MVIVHFGIHDRQYTLADVSFFARIPTKDSQKIERKRRNVMYARTRKILVRYKYCIEVGSGRHKKLSLFFFLSLSLVFFHVLLSWLKATPEKTKFA